MIFSRLRTPAATALDYGSLSTLAMLHTSSAAQVLSALETITRTSEVRRDLDIDLFELDLLDSLGVVELMVMLSDELGLELSPAEIERSEWATPRKIVAYVENRLGAHRTDGLTDGPLGGRPSHGVRPPFK
jgi:D-alanine--poly(phosphoribitol) ligase subunit 2